MPSENQRLRIQRVADSLKITNCIVVTARNTGVCRVTISRWLKRGVIPGFGQPESLRKSLIESRKEHFLRIAASCGSISHAAEVVGISRVTPARWGLADHDFAKKLDDVFSRKETCKRCSSVFAMTTRSRPRNGLCRNCFEAICANKRNGRVLRCRHTSRRENLFMSLISMEGELNDLANSPNAE